MININIVEDEFGFVRGFEISGHSGYAPMGKDIVCAAVSALAYTAVGAIEDMCDKPLWESSDGYMKCIITDDIVNKNKDIAKTILDTIVIGFKQIELSYGKYVRVVRRS
ncbi:MAG: ribosomal-processing cysteine protease Prp [Clostridiales bacterium]|nr:ribosomal-processing cysteine protease Prp [Clostridiales bacterium]